ncbi:MAG: hypothetical protein KGJ03_12960 [Betaproteobacteria bacterium]|nr:hypothetical protein [Betaproteobacteria bacterium]
MDEGGSIAPHELGQQAAPRRSDTQNQNLPRPVSGFKPTTTLKTIRQKTGEVSERDILNKTKPKR